MTPTTIGDRIAAELDVDPNKNAAAAAKFAGLGKSTLTELIKGRSKSSTKLHLIAKYLGVTVEWLETGKGPKHPPTRAIAGVSEFDDIGSHSPLRRIAVRGTWDMGTAGSTELDDASGVVEGYFEYPSTDPEAYIARVVGASLRPAIPHGWFVLVEPNSPLTELEYVVFRYRDQTFIRELTRHQDGQYWLSAITGNEPRIIASESEVAWIYPIAAVLPPSKKKLT